MWLCQKLTRDGAARKSLELPRSSLRDDSTPRSFHRAAIGCSHYFSDLVSEACQQAAADGASAEYAEAIKLYLTIAASKATLFTILSPDGAR